MIVDYQPSVGDIVMWTQYGPMPKSAADGLGLPYMPDCLGEVVRVLRNSFSVHWHEPGDSYAMSHGLHGSYPPRADARRARDVLREERPGKPLQ